MSSDKIQFNFGVSLNNTLMRRGNEDSSMSISFSPRRARVEAYVEPQEQPQPAPAISVRNNLSFDFATNNTQTNQTTDFRTDGEFTQEDAQAWADWANGLAQGAQRGGERSTGDSLGRDPQRTSSSSGRNNGAQTTSQNQQTQDPTGFPDNIRTWEDWGRALIEYAKENGKYVDDGTPRNTEDSLTRDGQVTNTNNAGKNNGTNTNNNAGGKNGTNTNNNAGGNNSIGDDRLQAAIDDYNSGKISYEELNRRIQDTLANPNTVSDTKARDDMGLGDMLSDTNERGRDYDAVVNKHRNPNGTDWDSVYDQGARTKIFKESLEIFGLKELKGKDGKPIDPNKASWDDIDAIWARQDGPYGPDGKKKTPTPTPTPVPTPIPTPVPTPTPTPVPTPTPTPVPTPTPTPVPTPTPTPVPTPTPTPVPTPTPTPVPTPTPTPVPTPIPTPIPTPVVTPISINPTTFNFPGGRPAEQATQLTDAEIASIEQTLGIDIDNKSRVFSIGVGDMSNPNDPMYAGISPAVRSYLVENARNFNGVGFTDPNLNPPQNFALLNTLQLEEQARYYGVTLQEKEGWTKAQETGHKLMDSLYGDRITLQENEIVGDRISLAYAMSSNNPKLKNMVANSNFGYIATGFTTEGYAPRLELLKGSMAQTMSKYNLGQTPADAENFAKGIQAWSRKPENRSKFNDFDAAMDAYADQYLADMRAAGKNIPANVTGASFMAEMRDQMNKDLIKKSDEIIARLNAQLKTTA